MKLIRTTDYDEMSKVAADILTEDIINNPRITLGLATGSTPTGLYSELVKNYKEGKISFKDIKTVNLDEYIGIGPDHPQSYNFFMKMHLFDKIDINIENTNIPNGLADDLDKERKRYDTIIQSLPNRIQLLGIGSNGHVGFNEPSVSFQKGTNVIDLKQSTISDNAGKYFDGNEEIIPKKAITMGIDQIMAADKIILIASGKNKSQAIFDTICGEISPNCPASIVREHPNAIIIIDEEAASLLPVHFFELSS